MDCGYVELPAHMSASPIVADRGSIFVGMASSSNVDFRTEKFRGCLLCSKRNLTLSLAGVHVPPENVEIFEPQFQGRCQPLCHYQMAPRRLRSTENRISMTLQSQAMLQQPQQPYSNPPSPCHRRQQRSAASI